MSASRTLGRVLFRLGFAFLLMLTLYVAAGRLLMPLAATQGDNIAASLSELTGTQVSIGNLSGDWWRFSPVLSLENFRMQFPSSASPGTSDSHLIQSLDLRLDFPRSLLQRRWIIDQVHIDQLHLDILESADGSWTLAGFRAGNSDYTQRILDLLFDTANLEISDISLNLQRNNGARLGFADGTLQMTNRQSGHQLLLQTSLEEQNDPIQFNLEIAGDPRADFDARSWFTAANLNLQPLLAFLDIDSIEVDELNGSGSFWLDFNQDGIASLQGNLGRLNVRGNDQSELSLDLANGEVSIALRKPSEQLWQLWLSDMTFDWRERSWEPADVYLQIDDSQEQRPVELLADRIDLSIATDLVLLSSDLPDQARSALEDLSPSGYLHNIRLKGNLAGDFIDGFRLQANLDEVALGPYNGAPAGWGINGYVQAERNSGFVELDSEDFRIHLPQLFVEPWEYDSANTRVHWTVSDQALQVNSSIIDIVNSEIHGRVQFDLFNTPNERGGWDSELSLLVGVLRFDASAKASYLPTLAGIADTMDWLEQAILSGQVEDSGFVFRGATHSDPPAGSSTVQSFFNFTDVSLRFLQDWPLLENVSGSVRVNNNDADIFTETAATAGITLDPVTASVRQNRSAPGSQLSLTGTASTGTLTGLNFLRNSPVHETIGDYIDNWDAEGNVELDLNLEIPLAVPDAAPLIEVAVVSDNSKLLIPDYGLEFDEISGRLNYSSASGLMANALSARLFDYPIAARIETIGSTEQAGTYIRSTGRASATALQNWSKQTDFVKNLLNFTQGEIDYRAELGIFSTDRSDGVLSRLTLESDLLGLALDLPAPFTKDIDDTRSFQQEVDFTADGEVLTTRYDQNLFSRLYITDGNLDRGLIHFGELNQDFNVRQSDSNQQGLTISGELDYFNFEDWSQVAETFTAADGSTDSPGLASNLNIVDVDFGQLDVIGQQMMDINAQVTPVDDDWHVYLENPLVRGDFDFPGAAGEPYRIRLDYLRLPASDEPEDQDASAEKPDILADINPATLPDMNFSTAEFSVGDKNLGAWEFNLDAFERGAHITDFIVRMADASITDAGSEGGATLEWQYRNRVHSTAFSGLFQAGNLAQVLPAMGYDANIESRSASFSGNLFWEGSPAAFSFVGSSGRVEVDIDNGRFVDIDSGSSRLLGAFSFDAIVRRLQLDFSDLFGRGLTFDNIDGGLMFDQGTVSTDERIVIEGPSSRISLTGQIDLALETIQADMLVTLPLSQNITVLAGILGAWPLAVSTYVASKIFQDQVDDFATVVYRLEGPWANPEAGFEPPDDEVEPEPPQQE